MQPTQTTPRTPQVFTRLLLGALPHELGNYIVECGEGVAVEGEIKVTGE